VSSPQICSSPNDERGQEINKILLNVARETKREKSLHVYFAPEGPMLVWAQAMAMPTDDIRKGSATKHATM
jgi:hypothetical protein